MEREDWLRWGRRAAALAAAAVCLQIGVVRVRSDRAASLQQELDALRAETAGRIEALEADLTESDRRARGLAQRLAQAGGRTAALSRELSASRTRAAVLEERVARLRATLRREPPALALRVLPDGALDRLVGVVENDGSQPLRVFASAGRLWVDGVEHDVGEGAASADVAPGDAVDLFEFRLLGDEPTRVANGASLLRGALCVAYERGVEDRASAWARELWFEYRPALESAAVLRRDHWQLADDEAACDLSLEPPPW